MYIKCVILLSKIVLLYFFNMFFFFFLMVTFIYLATLGLSRSMWDLVPWSGFEPGPPALGMQNFSHWTTEEIPCFILFICFYFWFHCIFITVHKLSLIVARGGYSSLQYTGFSLQWLLFCCRTQALGHGLQ